MEGRNTFLFFLLKETLGSTSRIENNKFQKDGIKFHFKTISIFEVILP
jgi:hypothetical protein